VTNAATEGSADTASPTNSEARQSWFSDRATVLHLLTLVIGGSWLVFLGRDHWFIADEWEFITNRGVVHPAIGLFVPHMQHWSTGPILVYRSLLNLFGLHSYLPYLVVNVLVHVLVVHLAWRVAVRAGADRWVATGLAALLLIAAPTAPNAWFAFQITFDGSVAFGLALLLLVDRRQPLGAARGALVAILAVVSLTFSAISVPLILSAALLLWLRRGWRVTLALFAPSGIAFVTWYEAVGRKYVSEGAGSVQLDGQSLRRLPAFVWHGLADTIGEPWQLHGFATTLALVAILGLSTIVVWQRRDGIAIAGCSALGGAVFFAVTSLGRANYGPTASRYLYVGGALLMPLIALAIGTLAAQGATWRIALGAALVVLLVFNARDLRRTAINQSAVDQALRQQILVVGQLVRSGAPIPGGVVPELAANPDLTVAKIRALIRAGWFPSGRVDIPDDSPVRVYPRVDVSSRPSSPIGDDAPTVVRVRGSATVVNGCIEIPNAPSGLLVLHTTGPASVRLQSPVLTDVQVQRATAAGKTRGMALVAVLHPGRAVYLDFRRADTTVIGPYFGGFTACGVAPAPARP
jgi:hypothetical protein